MARKPKTKSKSRKHKRPKPGWWGSLEQAQRRRLVQGGAVTILVVVVVVAGGVGLSRLEAHVEQKLVERAAPSLSFADLPDDLSVLAGDDLYNSVLDLLDRDWTDDRLCREMAGRLAAVGWVRRVNYVRRLSDARFKISCRYRAPVAMVQDGTEFLLIDSEGVRLPGTYLYDPAWRLIQGVAAHAPEPGRKWPGEDVDAGLTILRTLVGRPFADQLTAVLVDNFGGRNNSRATHIELATDRAGGRIQWGSAPQAELEENTIEQKLAILGENFRRTGRVDAHHLVIDISTFPDRFTIPG
jgi:hypothetical protein